MTTTPASPRELAELYFSCWQRKNFADLAPHLADEVTFDGPLATVTGSKDCLDGLTGLARATTDLDVRLRLADTTDVMTWFDLTVEGADPTPVVNWCHVDAGRIAAIRVTFDPRGMLEA